MRRLQKNRSLLRFFHACRSCQLDLGGTRIGQRKQ